MTRVDQSAEGHGQNFNAQGDITVNGLSITETQKLFEILLENNFPRLLEQARNTAQERCQELFLQFWDQLKKADAVDGSVFREPGVQADIADTLNAYGRSGNPETGSMLADL